jgi:hypothetical protein
MFARSSTAVARSRRSASTGFMSWYQTAMEDDHIFLKGRGRGLIRGNIC